IIDVQLGEFSDNLPPMSSIAASSTSVAINESITFTCSATDPNGDTLAYYWDFGDSKTSTNNQAVQTKLFSVAGVYTVRCEVSDKKGGVHSQQVLVTVGVPAKFQISG